MVSEAGWRALFVLPAALSGIVAALIVIMVVYVSQRYYFEVSSQFVIPLPSAPLDRAIVFPMAVVPNAWGVWNMVYLALRSRLRIPLAVHGSLLPLLR